MSKMSDSICMIIREAPYGTIQAAEAARHINGAIAGGLKTTVVLIEDGVYLAKEDQQARCRVDFSIRSFKTDASGKAKRSGEVLCT